MLEEEETCQHRVARSEMWLDRTKPPRLAGTVHVVSDAFSSFHMLVQRVKRTVLTFEDGWKGRWWMWKEAETVDVVEHAEFVRRWGAGYFTLTYWRSFNFGLCSSGATLQTS